MRSLLTCALLLAAVPAFADGPTVVATASKTQVSVGERFTVEVKASGPTGCMFEYPAQIAGETFELESVAPPAPAAKAQAPGAPAPPGTAATEPPGIHRYRASMFALGTTPVPAIAVRYRLADGTRGEVSTAPIPLRIQSLLPKDKDEQKLADVRAPVGLSIGRLFWIGLVLLIVLAAALGAWLWSRRRGAIEPAAVIAPVEPDEEARRALAELEGSGRLGRGEYRPYYIGLTTIVKRYLERRLGAPIVEMTTAEMLAHLRQAPHASEMAPLLRDLSGAADQIKFARGRGLVEEGERHLTAVRELIEGLEARLRPPEPESGKAA